MKNDTPDTIVRRTPWPESSSRPVGTPLQPSVVYASDSPSALDDQYEGRATGYTYAREGHPNADILAQKIDRLEGVSGGVITGSGMAAVTAVMWGCLKAGDHVVAGNQLYGRSLRMLGEDLPRFGITSTLCDVTSAKAVVAAITPQTRMILIEAVTNPTLRVADLPAIAKIAREKNVLLAVDNTFTTPRAVRPFEFGADIVIHSVTKLLAGHSDVTLGYAVAQDAALQQAIYTTAVTMGLTGSPFDCWLAERGLYSFELRYDRAEENAQALAPFLADLPGVARVIYPNRADHPDVAHSAATLGDHTGNMLSFVLNGGREVADRFAKTCGDIPFAPTLGDIATILSHPASSSHRALGDDGRRALGITEGFFRLSVGIEPIDLLKQELAQAVQAATR